VYDKLFVRETTTAQSRFVSDQIQRRIEQEQMLNNAGVPQKECATMNPVVILKQLKISPN
jgi:hypothetical protein